MTLPQWYSHQRNVQHLTMVGHGRMRVRSGPLEDSDWTTRYHAISCSCAQTHEIAWYRVGIGRLGWRRATLKAAHMTAKEMETTSQWEIIHSYLYIELIKWSLYDVKSLYLKFWEVLSVTTWLCLFLYETNFNFKILPAFCVVYFQTSLVHGWFRVSQKGLQHQEQ